MLFIRSAIHHFKADTILVCEPTRLGQEKELFVEGKNLVSEPFKSCFLRNKRFMRPPTRFWEYSYFQIPLMLVGMCLAAATLFWLFGFGRPPVTVAIALDISGSTYGNDVALFNTPNTTMAKEVQAIEAYLEKNSQLTKTPNEIQVFGFAGLTLPLTKSFQSDPKKLRNELGQSLDNPRLSERIVPDSTDIELAIAELSEALSAVGNRCRELLIVTDGQASVSRNAIEIAENLNIKINSVVLGDESNSLKRAAAVTGGLYISDEASNLSDLFSDKFFNQFNNNWRWIIFWLGFAWVFFMWTLYLPLDRTLHRFFLAKRPDISGKAAFLNALFWTVATPGIIWRIANGIPFVSRC